MKINKRILRCEYAEIAPDMPDFETQQRLNPGIIAHEIHQYVAGHVETEVPSKDKAYQNCERLPCVADKGTFQADTSTAPSAEGHRFWFRGCRSGLSHFRRLHSGRGGHTQPEPLTKRGAQGLE